MFFNCKEIGTGALFFLFLRLYVDGYIKQCIGTAGMIMKDKLKSN
jgi:hypothetical protein